MTVSKESLAGWRSNNGFCFRRRRSSVEDSLGPPVSQSKAQLHSTL
jgi:hypothetical protein